MDKNLAFQIIEKIKTQPLERVYTEYFAGNPIDNLIYEFYYVMDPKHYEDTKFTYDLKEQSCISRKVSDLCSVVIKIIELNERTKFPGFIEFYLTNTYQENGLLKQVELHNYWIFGIEYLDRGPDRESYEEYLISNFLKEEAEIEFRLWEENKVKRNRVEKFEGYYYKLLNKLSKLIESQQNQDLEEFNNIIDNAKKEVEAEIDRILLFEGNTEKANILKQYLNFIESNIRNYDFYLLNFKESLGDSLPLDVDYSISASLLIFKEIGILELLKKVTNENGRDLEKLISYLIKHPNPDSIGRYFPGMADPDSPARNTPYTKPAIKKMQEILKDCNIEVKGNYTKKGAKNTD